MLHALAHLHQVLQDVARGRLHGLDVHARHGDEQVEPREHVPAALHLLVQLHHRLALLLEAREVVLQVPQLVQHL